MKALWLLALTGCFDSIVDANRFAHDRPDAAATDELADAAVEPPVDATVAVPPDAACSLDLTTDPDNCGACGRVCASGICEAGHCAGELSGHIVAIGHDYREHDAAMRRVLGNALALAVPHDIAIARMPGSATAPLQHALAPLGRTWHEVALPATPSLHALAGADVLVVEAQPGDAASARARGAAWSAAIDKLLQRGGVIVVLEGTATVSHELADGAALFTATPVDATGQHALVTDGSDAVTQQVVSPYLADTTSVTFPGLAGPIGTIHGAIVVHQTRY